MMSTEGRPTRRARLPVWLMDGNNRDRTTYQLTARLGACDEGGGSSRELKDRAVAVALEWLSRKLKSRFGPDAAEGKSFTVEHGTSNLWCVSLPEKGIWTARLRHPDWSARAKTGVPGRMWTTDLSIKENGEAASIGIRVYCSSEPNCVDPVTPAPPHLVRLLSDDVGLRDGVPITPKPHLITTAQDIEAFVDLLTSPERRLPVYLLTEAPDEPGLQLAQYVLNADTLADELLGLAHIYLMPADVTFAWTTRVGKVWSAFNGSVRTYRPGLDFLTDEPFRHPLASLDRVLFWDGGGRTGEVAFEEFLIDCALSSAVSRRLDHSDWVFYTDARLLEAQATNLRGIGASSESQSLWDTIERYRDQQRESQEYLDYADTAIKTAESERDQALAQNYALRARIDQLDATIMSMHDGVLGQTESVPDTLAGVEEWCDGSLVGKVVLLSRARQGLKSGNYDNVGLMCEALRILAEDYRDKQRGLECAAEKLDAALKQSGLKIDKAITDARAGQEGEKYQVKYPPGSERTRMLEWHVWKGKSHDSHKCLRIYFFWDADTQQVVIGWLPSHLPNRFS